MYDGIYQRGKHHRQLSCSILITPIVRFEKSYGKEKKQLKLKSKYVNKHNISKK